MSTCVKLRYTFLFLNGLLRLGENTFLCYIGVYIEVICVIGYTALTLVGHVKVSQGFAGIIGTSHRSVRERMWIVPIL